MAVGIKQVRGDGKMMPIAAATLKLPEEMVRSREGVATERSNGRTRMANPRPALVLRLKGRHPTMAGKAADGLSGRSWQSARSAHAVGVIHRR
jgi:hypothetical protein